MLGLPYSQRTEGGDHAVGLLQCELNRNPNTIAFARYETTGENGLKAEAFVRHRPRKMGYLHSKTHLAKRNPGLTKRSRCALPRLTRGSQ